MEHGALPWNAARPDALWYQQVLETLATSHTAITLLRRQVMDNRDYLLRILLQHTQEFIAQLLTIITARKQNNWALLIQQLYDAHRLLQPAGNTPLSRRTFEQSCWHTLLLEAVKDPAAAEPVLISSLLVQQPVVVTEMQALLRVCRNNGWNELLSAAISFNAEHSTQLQKEIPAALSDEDAPQAEGTDAPEEETPGTPAGANTFYVVNAGIILLHHWLTPMFTQLEWTTDGKKFVNAACQKKAIMLLHYMATGETEAEEFELMLPKLLCGWPLKRPLDTKLAPAAAAIEEAEGLIENAISYWKALKNISADGLREGFLQRPGRLITGTDKHQLQMEPDTIDILLDRLPWNISIIKLKWMKIPLHVQWR